MHKYLKTIGFTELDSYHKLEEVLRDVEETFEQKKIFIKKNHRMMVSLSKDYGYDCGITVCGEYDEEGIFHREYYYPYYRGQTEFPAEDVVVERHADKESFAGAYDDYSIGITLIFFLINPIEYLRMHRWSPKDRGIETLAFSALADTGKILLPIRRTALEKEKSSKTAEKRNTLIAAAQKGDQEAIESLTMEDIDLYALLAKRVQTEDLYSIIHTTFMPCGIECDQYSVIGEIEDVAVTKNSRTGERLYQLKIRSNDIPVDVCINERDLLGVPEPGRRFKGKIWLQGILQ
ncbi:MAG: DUF3881 family protein [Lachnospiraceae bacterium]|nr:DUF3881 family protein [Lachnospiraceae bacterium]